MNPSSEYITTQRFTAGHMIFRQGDTGDVAYIINSGKVQIIQDQDGKQVELAVLGKGSVFGELALIDNSRRAATAKVVEDAVCTTIDREYIQKKVSEADKTVQVLFKLMLNMIRANNAKK